MNVDIIVAAFHGDRWLAPCTAFLRDHEEKGVRLIIADNFGNSTISSLVDGARILSVDLPGPLGFAEANNLTLIKTGIETEFICFLNQDTKSSPGWLSRAADFLARHPDVGAVTPLIATYDGKDWDPNFIACAKPLPPHAANILLSPKPTRNGRSSANHQKTLQVTVPEFYEVPVIPAVAMVVRAEVLKKAGGFDPIYGSYYEDYDLCLRIRRAGYRVGIWTGATVSHFSGSATETPEAERRRQRLIVRNRIIYRVRRAGRRRLFRLGHEFLRELPRQLGRRLLGRPASKPVVVLLGGHWDAAKVIHRLISPRRDEKRWKSYLREIDWELIP